MFLAPLLTKNRRFVEATIALHQAGSVPANSYVIDLDTLTANTTHLLTEARLRDLTVYAMTKQLGRSPSVLDALTAAGVDGYVAVDMTGARAVSCHGHNLGHLGHLVQVPLAETVEAAGMEPDYWTVFSPHKAAAVSTAASAIGREQDLLVRVFDSGDEFYPGHEGGVALDDLTSVLGHIEGLPGVNFAGFTTFPAVLFDPATQSVRATSNIETLARAVEIAQRYFGHLDRPIQVNAPGTTSTAVLAQLQTAGATQVEPGHGLTGTTPLHAVVDLPEQPAVLYLSEVAHLHQGVPFCFGGGLYIDPVFGAYNTTAVIAHDPREATTAPVPVDIPDPASIGYYAKLHPGHQRTVEEGASVIFGFRIQAFVTRAHVAAIAGTTTGNPQVVAVSDVYGHPSVRGSQQ